MIKTTCTLISHSLSHSYYLLSSDRLQVCGKSNVSITLKTHQWLQNSIRHICSTCWHHVLTLILWKKYFFNWSKTHWYTEDNYWRGAAAVDSRGWACLNVMMWLLVQRIHCWWQRCSDEVVLTSDAASWDTAAELLHCVMSCCRQTDSSSLLVLLLQTEAKCLRPRLRPKL